MSADATLTQTRFGAVWPVPLERKMVRLCAVMVGRGSNPRPTEWRTARGELGVAEVTTHSFRKTVATLIDDEGLSARIGADHLGHSHVSMTQDRYMTRGRSTRRWRTCSTAPSA